VLEGKPGRDEQIEKVQTTIRNMGRAGIGVLGYHFNVLGVWRTKFSPRGRGGATVSSYDHALVENAPLADCGPIDDDALWESYTYFLRAIVPVAEEAGVMLALHPNDPPVPAIAGVARLIRHIDDYKRIMALVDSSAHGIDFCQGTVAEMCAAPRDIYDAIRHWVTRKKIAYVHLRNVRGTLPRFEESFIDDGKVDMLEAMRAYHDAGFEGVFIVDHTPKVVGDTPWGHRGRAYAIGYIKGLQKCVCAG